MSLVQQSSVQQSLVERLKQRWRDITRRLIPQLSKFGVVGLVALAVDVGLFNLLRFAGGHGVLYDQPLAAKVVSASAATVLSWLGNRYWTFRLQRRSNPTREFALFVVVCVVGTAVALLSLAVSHYLLGLQSPLADNISANVVGLAAGTTFRFWAYRRYVFSESHVRAARPARLPVDVRLGLGQPGSQPVGD